MQTIDFTDKVNITCLLDMANCHKIGVVGSRVSVLDVEVTVEEMPKFSGVKTGCSSNGLWILTQGDIRWYDWKSGRLRRI